jgi:hypothetical protein
VCFLVEFMTWFFFVLVSFFGVKFAYFGWFSQDTRLSTVVPGFFRSSTLQPWSCQFFTMTHGLHAPGRSLLGPMCVGHSLSSRTWLGVFRWIRGLPANFCCIGGLRCKRACEGATQRRSRFWLLFRIFFVVFFFSLHSLLM